MSEVLRFKAPGPWVTRELRECVQASDYDALAAQLETMRASCAQAARDAVQFQDERNALSAQCQDVRAQRDTAQAERDRLSKENDHMRGLLSHGSDPCIYCGLRASEMGRCARGFPGCARGDDMMNAPPECENWTRKGQPQS